MNLIVDVGNTLVKFAVFDQGELLHKIISLKVDFKKNLDSIANQFSALSNAVLCQVGELSEQSINQLKKKYRIYDMLSFSKFPFENLYTTPQTLGVDRLALVAAAAAFYPKKNVLVIDMGTCITYDFINSKKQYMGGAISPGFTMRYKALHAFTDKLPLLDIQPQKVYIGNSTQTSMHSGVFYGIHYEIDATIDRYREDYEDLTVILTGGNAHFLLDSLKNSIFANSNFLLQGLNFLLDFNLDT